MTFEDSMGAVSKRTIQKKSGKVRKGGRSNAWASSLKVSRDAKLAIASIMNQPGMREALSKRMEQPCPGILLKHALSGMGVKAVQELMTKALHSSVIGSEVLSPQKIKKLKISPSAAKYMRGLELPIM